MADVEFTSALDRRDSTRAMFLAIGILGVALLLTATNSAIASTALSRLFWPFGDRAWPKQVELQLVTGELKPIDVLSSKPLRTAISSKDLTSSGKKGLVMSEMMRP